MWAYDTRKREPKPYYFVVDGNKWASLSSVFLGETTCV
jgi:hypothetical protein